MGSKKCLPGCDCGKHSGGPSSYSAKHYRVRSRRGSATGYTCTDCGGQARDWALIHGRDGEDPDDFQPMCHRCHFRYDDVSGDMRGQPSPMRGVPRPENYGHSWNGKLDEAKVQEIRRLLAEGEMSLRAIGRKFDVRHGQIIKIRDGKNWYWLDSAES